MHFTGTMLVILELISMENVCLNFALSLEIL